MANPSVAVIGAGFSGTLVALNLLRQAPAGTRISLIERNCTFGPGLAYSTANASHLLNVPAGRMSAFEDPPRDFLDWLQHRSKVVIDEGAFVPRQLCGRLSSAPARRSTMRQHVGRRACRLVHDSVKAVARDGGGLKLMFASGQTLTADIAVLATGNAQPEPPSLEQPGLYDSSCWRPDPWAADTFADLDRNAPVMLIGTGLTMVDAVISLLDQDHVGPIHAISRRGLLPRRHAVAHAPRSSVPLPLLADVRELARFLRCQVARAVDAGEDWRPVIDALRPITRDLWQALSVDDRKRFLRHLRPWWDVHRHRMPGAVADRIDAARASGQLRIAAGRIIGGFACGDAVDVRYRPRGDDACITLRTSRVVNCTGPATGLGTVTDPLISSLVRDGTVRPDALRLGLDVTASGAVRGRNGARLPACVRDVGPLTRAAF